MPGPWDRDNKSFQRPRGGRRGRVRRAVKAGGGARWRPRGGRVGGGGRACFGVTTELSVMGRSHGPLRPCLVETLPLAVGSNSFIFLSVERRALGLPLRPRSSTATPRTCPTSSAWIERAPPLPLGGPFYRPFLSGPLPPTLPLLFVSCRAYCILDRHNAVGPT